MKIYGYLLSILILFTTGYSKEKIVLSHDENAILNVFFKVLLKDSEAGYVLFNAKPVCIHGFYSKDPFYVDSPLHKQSVALREGALIWKKINLKKSDLFIQISEKEDPNIPRWIHVLTINTPLFHKTVNKNLSLFQYILGPSTTSDALFKAFTSTSNTFDSLLKSDKVLIGEILGFGTQNSLYVSRLENILEAAETEIPPFLNAQQIVHQNSAEYVPHQPSLGFSSFQEETKELENRLTLSSKKLTEYSPEFIFGRLKDSKETDILVNELEKAQIKIQNLLKSPIFLAETLKKFSTNEFVLSKREPFHFKFNKEEVNCAVAKGLWESVQDYDHEYLIHFINGLISENLNDDSYNRLSEHPNYLRELIEAQQNLTASTVFFNELENNKNYNSLINGKLYTKTLVNGNGDLGCNSPFVKVNYSIFSPLGHCLSYQSNKTINLKNTISGFAHGIKGMKINETREIFIHPELAYGFNTSLEKCTYIKAIVTLLDIDTTCEDFPCLLSHDLAFLQDPNELIEREKNYKLALQNKGKRIGNHLKKCAEIDLITISQQLKSFYNNEEKFHPTTQEEQNLINKVHWNIYYGQS